jgi:hypothetical protein
MLYLLLSKIHSKWFSDKIPIAYQKFAILKNLFKLRQANQLLFRFALNYYQLNISRMIKFF